MEGLLNKEGVWDLITGKKERPTTGPNSKAFLAWDSKRCIAHAQLILHVSEKYIGICESNDPKKIWDDLAMLFRARGQGAVAAMRRRFNTMIYDLDNSMKEWITEVETQAQQLEHIGHPMHTLDIYNTLIRNLPDSYLPLIVFLDGLPTDPDDPASLNIELVKKQLIDEEVRQLMAFGMEDAFYSSYRSPAPTSHAPHVKRCFNCGKEGHIKTDCDISPRELRECKEQYTRQGSRKPRTPCQPDDHVKVVTMCANCSDCDVVDIPDPVTGSDMALF